MFGTVPASRASRESPFVVVMDVLRGLEECGFQKAREQLNKARFQCTNVSSFQSVNMDCTYSIGILAYVPRFGRPLDKVRMTAIARNTPTSSASKQGRLCIQALLLYTLYLLP